MHLVLLIKDSVEPNPLEPGDLIRYPWSNLNSTEQSYTRDQAKHLGDNQSCSQHCST